MTADSPTNIRYSRLGVLICTLAFVIFICAFAYGYFQLAKVNVSLAQMVSDLQKEAVSDKANIAALQSAMSHVQEQVVTSKSTLDQQAQTLADWQVAQKGDMNRWYVAEAQYLVKLANDHAQYTHNIPMALVLVQHADEVLKNLNDDSLLPVRKALASDEAELRAVPQIDTTSLYVHLSGLDSQIDQLPLPATPLKAVPQAPTVTDGLPWWKAALAQTTDALRKIVVVRYDDSHTLPLVMPDEKLFLYQNLHAQLEAAMWAVLHRNAEVYQSSLARAAFWVQRYFAQDAPATLSILQGIDTLRKVNIQPPAVHLADTLALFDTYFAQTAQTKTVTNPA